MSSAEPTASPAAAAAVEAQPSAARAPVPPLTPQRELLRAVIMVILVLSAGMVLHLTWLSGMEQRSVQQQMFDELRLRLAEGTAPIGPNDSLTGEPIENGRPLAFLEIPEIDVDQVVVAGTRSGDLFKGPGHRRDTPLPGQAGVSVIYGKRASYGGPFGDLADLDPGDLIRVTTGQGTFEYSVLGVRREGDPIPVGPTAGSSRLILATADGRPFLPSGVLRVDADLIGQAVGGDPRPTLGGSEGLLDGDSANLWVLAFWIQALILAAVASIWSWHRWGRAQTWIVFLPVLAVVGLSAAGEASRLMPNLL